ncbi:hypothetical protein MN608_07101 [Microdochium nivale]|nr:hypothetical protein MN608_07101 [Microdochium nivale]
MGANSSKPVARQAAKHATRKFPSRPPGAGPATTTRSAGVPPPREGATPSGPQRGEQQQQTQQASFTKDDAIRADGMDPQSAPGHRNADPNHHTNAAFSQRLRNMGIATPNPTLSNSSIVNSSSDNSNNSSNNIQDPSLSRQAPSPTTTSLNPSLSSSLRQDARNSSSGRTIPTRPRAATDGVGPSVTLNALAVRKELAERATAEFERGGNTDREFLDVDTLRQILQLVERGGGGAGASDAAIEQKLRLKRGVVARLVGGKAKGVFAPLA